MNGHFEVVKWIYERCPTHRRFCIFLALKGGHLEITKWLCNEDKGNFNHQRLMDGAAKNGNLDVVRWSMHST